MTQKHIDIDSFLDSIRKICSHIQYARDLALANQVEELNDDAQVLGMRAYKCLGMLLQTNAPPASEEGIRPYDVAGRMTVRITNSTGEHINLRIWRAEDPELPAEEKRLIQSTMCPNMELFPVGDAIPDRWGIVYQTDEDRLLDTAYLIGYNHATLHPTFSREIELREKINTPPVDASHKPEAKQLPPGKNKVKPKKSAKDREHRNQNE